MKKAIFPMNFCLRQHDKLEIPRSGEPDAVCEAPVYNFPGILALSDTPEFRRRHRIFRFLNRLISKHNKRRVDITDSAASYVAYPTQRSLPLVSCPFTDSYTRLEKKHNNFSFAD